MPAHPTTTPGEVRCKHCGATDVYWMTCATRREAEFISRKHNKPLAMKLASARLFNLSGGEHHCPTTPEGFDEEPV